MGISAYDQGRRQNREPYERELLVVHRHEQAVGDILGDFVEKVEDPEGDTGLVRMVLRPHVDVTAALDRLRKKVTAAQYPWSPMAGRNHRTEIPVIGQPEDSVGSGGARPWPPLAYRRDSPIGAGVTIGVVDSRVWASNWLYGAVVAHPDGILQSQDLDVDNDGRLDPQAGHATFTAGLILREAPGAMVRVDPSLSNAGHGTTSRVVAAAVRLARQKVDILNLSLGCYTKDGGPPLGFVQMLRHIHPEIVIVAAAGNRPPIKGTTGAANGADVQYAPASAFFPAALDGVVAVAAVTDKPGACWRPAPFSNYGPWLDFAAPGVDVHSTFVDFEPKEPSPAQPTFRGWASWSGTSFATAIASGTIAATMSERHLSAREAVEHLRAARVLRATFDDRTSVPVLEQSPWPDAQ